jgi:diaminopimelate epimerase
MTLYTKLNSQGNDFILIDTNHAKTSITVDDIIYYSRRDKIGCDQFFIINPEDKDNVSVKFIIKMDQKLVSVAMDLEL